jgi:mRNA interferase RelE/StbE
LTSSSRPAPPARTYTLKFVLPALTEWRALDGSVKANLKKLLAKRLENPHVRGSELRGELRGCYKIKLRKQGYRLVYQVDDDVLVVLVLAVGKRENDGAYRAAFERLRNFVRRKVDD